MIKSLSIIFPLYNEAKRLKYCFYSINKFNTNSKIKNLEFIFVNDGSTDQSLFFITKFKKENIKKIKIKVVSYKKNRGKGYALKKGVLSSSNEWILTIDTDLSVSLNQIHKWNHKNLIKKNCSYFGSRLVKNSKIVTKKYRSIVGVFFNVILKFLIKDSFLKIRDTQCGFKLYNKNAAKFVFKNIKEWGYIHDVEILIILRNYNFQVYELPVNWIHKDGSKINLIRDSVKMFLGLIRLKINYRV